MPDTSVEGDRVGTPRCAREKGCVFGERRGNVKRRAAAMSKGKPSSIKNKEKGNSSVVRNLLYVLTTSAVSDITHCQCPTGSFRMGD